MRFITSCKKLFLPLGLILILTLLILFPIIGLDILYPGYLQRVNSIISQSKAVFIVFRWAILIIIYALWPRFIRGWGRRKNWPANQVNFWINQRAKIIGWLILFEIVVCENLALVCIHLWERI